MGTAERWRVELLVRSQKTQPTLAEWSEHSVHPHLYAGTRLVRVVDGPGDGSRLLQAWCPSGPELDIAVERGFDVVGARPAGVPLAWLSPTGLMPRTVGDPQGFGWMKSFRGGLLTTCGLSHYGTPATLSDVHNAPPHEPVLHHGEHERASHLSADPVRRELVLGTTAHTALTAVVREAALHQDCSELRREITISPDRPEVIIKDRVTGVGPLPARHALLHHLDLGSPLVREGATVGEVFHSQGATDAGVGGVRQVVLGPATPEAREMVHDWQLSSDVSGTSEAAMQDPASGALLHLTYSADTLPRFLVLILRRRRASIVGLAPATATAPEVMLEPDETRSYSLNPRFGAGSGSRRSTA